MTAASPVLSIVVPAHNEVENVAPLLHEIVSTLENRWSFEVIFIDDGSNDGTDLVLKKLLDGSTTLRIIQHARRAGQSAAIRNGAKAARGRWIVTLDGDGQNNPADIPKLVERILSSEDNKLKLVGGLRLKRQDSRWKKLGTKIGNGVRQTFLRDRCPDTGCGLKVFDKEAFLDLPAFASMHRFLPALFQSQGWTTEFIPIGHRPRRYGTSKYGNLRRGLIGRIDLLGVIWLTSRTRAPDKAEIKAQKTQ